MDIQFIIAVGITLASFLYIIFRFTKQLKEVENDPKCGNCPIVDIDPDKINLDS